MSNLTTRQEIVLNGQELEDARRVASIGVEVAANWVVAGWESAWDPDYEAEAAKRLVARTGLRSRLGDPGAPWEPTGVDETTIRLLGSVADAVTKQALEDIEGWNLDGDRSPEARAIEEYKGDDAALGIRVRVAVDAIVDRF